MDLDDVLYAEFSSAETAGALEHGNFNDFRRNLIRDGKTVLPRNSTRGRGGPGYAYAHVFEMACHIPVASRYGRDTAMQVCWGLFRFLQRQVTDTAEFQKDFGAIAARSDEFEEDRFNLSDVVIAPRYFFGEDRISRDRDNRTWLLFLPHRIQHNNRALTMLQEKDGADLASIRDQAFRLATVGTKEDDARAKHMFGYEALGPGLIDLTGIVTRFEEELRFRLRARNVGKRG